MTKSFAKMYADNAEGIAAEGVKMREENQAELIAWLRKLVEQEFSQYSEEAINLSKIANMLEADGKAKTQSATNVLSLDWIEERAHRRCAKYISIDTEAPYHFTAHTLADFVRDVLKEALK